MLTTLCTTTVEQSDPPSTIPPLVFLRIGRIWLQQKAFCILTSNEILAALRRHQIGDWGDVNYNEREVNDLAMIHHDRVISVYHSASGVEFWLVTEQDRSETAIIFPHK